MADTDMAAEITLLKQELEQHRMMLQTVLVGLTALNKRIEAVEAFVITTSELTRVTLKLLTEHLDALRQLDQETLFPASKVVQRGIEVA